MPKERIRFTITSGDLSTSFSCDCQKWIRHLATNRVKLDDLNRLLSGRFPAGKMFVLDMIHMLRKTDPHLDRVLAKRGGILPDDHLSIDFSDVRQLMNREFPELVVELATAGSGNKVIKRRPGAVDLTPLNDLAKKR